MSKPRAIAWDFDGVLNRSIVDGKFFWVQDFERDLGQSLARFEQAIFNARFDHVVTGREDLLDRVAAWVEAVGFTPGARHK